MSKKITFLGTGTSSGVPTISCHCPVCKSNDCKDKRLRSSVLIESESTEILIDTSPDFRQQMLTYDIEGLDAVLYTHHHFDHIGGFDDLRALNYTSHQAMPIYLMKETFEKIKRTFFYAFEELEQIGGGVPIVKANFISDKIFKIGDIEIQPIPLIHGKMEVLGFRIDDFAYCTDTNFIPPQSYSYLSTLKYLVLDALRYNEHPTHFSLSEAIDESKKINAKHTYFTHIAHEIMYSECNKDLPANMNLAYDGLVLKI